MEIYEKFGKDEDLAEKERTFKNDKGDTLTITPKNENEFLVHHKAASGKEWKEKHSRVQTSNMLDRFLNKGLVEEMEDIKEAKRESLEDSGYEYVGKHKDGGHILKDKKTGKKEVWHHNPNHASYGIKHGKLDLEFVHSLDEDEQLSEQYHVVKTTKGGVKSYFKGPGVQPNQKNVFSYDKEHAFKFDSKENAEKHAKIHSAEVHPVNEDEQLDEGVKTKYKYQGKIYNTKAFKTVKGANAFMDKNPQHGLLDVEKDEEGNEKAYHVAHVRDVGIKENSIIQNVYKRNHADAIPQFNQKIMALVYEKMNDLFVEVAGKSFNKVDEEKNPHISSKWPAKLHRKIDAYHDGKYIGSSNAYKSLKDAKHGFAHSKKLDLDKVKTIYSE